MLAHSRQGGGDRQWGGGTSHGTRWAGSLARWPTTNSPCGGIWSAQRRRSRLLENPIIKEAFDTLAASYRRYVEGHGLARRRRPQEPVAWPCRSSAR